MKRNYLNCAVILFFLAFSYLTTSCSKDNDAIENEPDVETPTNVKEVSIAGTWCYGTNEYLTFLENGVFYQYYYETRYLKNVIKGKYSYSNNVLELNYINNNHISLEQPNVTGNLTIDSTKGVYTGADNQTLNLQKHTQPVTIERLEDELAFYQKELEMDFSGKFESTGTENGYEYIDLGLSVKWATMNIGATTIQDYGSYYAWGEVSPKTTTYTWETYKFVTSGYSDFTGCKKYQVADGKTNAIYYKNGNFVGDNKTTLDLEDDAAHINMGGNWRMPTAEEQNELLDNAYCIWTSIVYEGVSGFKIVSKKNGNAIFLPAAGSKDTSLHFENQLGDYWSSTMASNNTGNAISMNFRTYNEKGSGNIDKRCWGNSIRAVCP